MAFLENWHVENKPRVLLFDQIPIVPLLYKVGEEHIQLQANRSLITEWVVQPASSPAYKKQKCMTAHK